MCDCGNGRGVPKDPCLLEYNIDGTLKHTIKLKLPLMVSTKLRFMDVYGEFIFISDLGESSSKILSYLTSKFTLCYVR